MDIQDTAEVPQVIKDGDITVVVHEVKQTRSPDEKGGEWSGFATAYDKNVAFVSFNVTIKYLYSPQLGYAEIYDTKISNVKKLNGFNSLASVDQTHTTSDEVWIMTGYLGSNGAIVPPLYMTLSVNSSGYVTVGGDAHIDVS